MGEIHHGYNEKATFPVTVVSSNRDYLSDGSPRRFTNGVYDELESLRRREKKKITSAHDVDEHFVVTDDESAKNLRYTIKLVSSRTSGTR